MIKKTLTQNSWIILIQFMVGLLFIFSGFIKLNDPLGFSYKLEEYFEVFDMEPLKFLSLFLSVFFCSLEIILGFALIIGYKIRWVVPGILILILFFTFLTFYSAYFNKVTECGCFGDAIKLTPWQSFYKNMVLTALILLLVYFRKNLISLFKPGLNIGLMILVFILTLGFGIYSYWFLPVLDFLPYKVGNHIQDFIEIPKGEQGDVFSVIYTLKNAKTGEIKTINDQDYIKTKIYENPDWVYQKASEPVLIHSGYQAPARDFKVADSLGKDITQSLLADSTYTLWVVEYDLNKTPGDLQKSILNLSRALDKKGIKTLGLTSVTVSDSRKLIKPYALDFPFYFCDAVPLKSMVRSNPGLVLIHSGTVIAKWSSHALPQAEDILKISKIPF
jgi:uncharacterized membrane protein YphA (DoxX/SURF4 family)